MLKKVVYLRNIGKFKNSAYTPNPQWGKHTVVYAPNGTGKSTLTCVLRSLGLQDANLIAARRSLSSQDDPTAHLLFDDGSKEFKGGAWTSAASGLSIFDGVFIHENVHAGDLVDVQNRRRLYRIIVGNTGLALAQREQELTEGARLKQNEITEVERRIGSSIPAGISKAQFLGLEADGEVDRKISETERRIRVIEQGETIRARAILEVLPVIDIANDGLTVLNKTLDGGSADQLDAVQGHCEKHNFSSEDRSWIAKGMDFVADDSCGFCGRGGLDGLELYKAYKTIFRQEYRQLSSEVEESRRSIDRAVGASRRAQIETVAARNEGAVEFWKQHCVVADLALPDAMPILRELEDAEQLYAEVIGRKGRMLLDPIPSDDETLLAAQGHVSRARELAVEYDAVVNRVNALINTTKGQLERGDLASERQALQILLATKARQDPNVSTDCTTLETCISEKREMEEEKSRVRQQLEDHCRAVLEPYENRINHYLGRFNAGFRIAQTGYAYPGGIATSQYQLVIDNTNVGLGDERTPDNQPCFKNTLSTGDRTTLALAFFLASLEADADIGNKVVVFDDPFSSQDSFRQTNTVFEIMKIGERCKQVIVLSHDSRFLKLIWDKCPNDTRVAVQISNHGDRGSQITEFVIEDVNRGRTRQDLDDLIGYRSTGVGNPRDIIRKLRVVLETHFRSSYPGSFGPDDNCGEILRKIRETGETHPAYLDYEPLERINDYTANYHHGEDARGAAEPDIDPTELGGFINDTLRIVNAVAD